MYIFDVATGLERSALDFMPGALVTAQNITIELDHVWVGNMAANANGGMVYGWNIPNNVGYQL